MDVDLSWSGVGEEGEERRRRGSSSRTEIVWDAANREVLALGPANETASYTTDLKISRLLV